MTKPLVIAFVGQNANQILYSASDGFNSCLQRHGLQTAIIDISNKNPESLKILQQLLGQHQLLFAYGFAGIGAGLMSGTENFWHKNKLPFLSLLFDHPFYKVDNHDLHSSMVANCYFCQDFLEVQQKYVQSSQPSFLQRLGIYPHRHIDMLPLTQRNPRPVFLKSGGAPQQILQTIQQLPRPLPDLCHEIIRVAQQDADLPLADAVAAAFSLFNMSWQQQRQAFIACTRLIDEYVRVWRANEMVEFLKTQDAIIIGSGWEHIDKVGAKARFMPAINGYEAQKLYGTYQTIINTNPVFRHGYHERVFTALHCGAVAISDRNMFSDEHFATLPSFMSFDWADSNWREKVMDNIKQVQQNPPDTLTAEHAMPQIFSLTAQLQQMMGIAQKLIQNRA